jgi:hypothetical protein
VDFSLTGQQDLYRIASWAHQAGRKDLTGQLDRASRKAGAIIEAEIRASTDTYAPKGFEERLRQNLETKTEVKLRSHRRITVVVGARGKQGRRHVKQMNEGSLRHPVHGRNRRLKDGTLQANPWVAQRIRPGLVDEPGLRAMPRAKEEIDKALGRVVAKLGRAG